MNVVAPTHPPKIPFSAVVYNLSHDIGNLYDMGKDSLATAIARSPLHAVADHIYGYIVGHANVFLWTATAFNAISSPLFFGAGLLGGLTLQLGYHIGYNNHRFSIISSESNKVEYAILTTISRLFLKAMLLSSLSGFVVGNYLGNYGLRHDIIPVFLNIKDHLSSIPSLMSEIVNEPPPQVVHVTYASQSLPPELGVSML